MSVPPAVLQQRVHLWGGNISLGAGTIDLVTGH